MTKTTQEEKIINYMKQYGGITPLDAIRDLGCMRLASRISDIKKRGVPIKGEMIAVRNRMGDTTYVKRYSIDENAGQMTLMREI